MGETNKQKDRDFAKYAKFFMPLVCSELWEVGISITTAKQLYCNDTDHTTQLCRYRSLRQCHLRFSISKSTLGNYTRGSDELKHVDIDMRKRNIVDTFRRMVDLFLVIWLLT